MSRPESEFDFQRPDNPNRIYSSRVVVTAMASIINGIISTAFRSKNISAVIVEPLPGVGFDPAYGLDIDGDERQKERLVKIAKRIAPRLEKIAETKTVQELGEFVSKATLRFRGKFGKEQV